MTSATYKLMKQLAGDRRGITSVEFAIVCVVFLMIVLGIIDFSRALWEWNMAAKATQQGVRYAVVHNIIAQEWQDLDGTTLVKIGSPIPDGSLTPDTMVCTIAGCGPTLGTLSNDPTKFNALLFQDLVDEMRRYYDRIDASKVIVEYHHIGLGMAGNPFGPDLDPLVTVRLVDMDFNFLTPGLADLASPIDLPPFVATLTGEDGKDN